MLLIFQSHGWAGVLNGVDLPLLCLQLRWPLAPQAQSPPVATGQPGHSGDLTQGPSLETNLYILGLYIALKRGAGSIQNMNFKSDLRKGLLAIGQPSACKLRWHDLSKKSDLTCCAKIARWQSWFPISISVLLKIVPEGVLSNWRNHFFFKAFPIGG